MPPPDPYLLALACYRFPDADDPQGRRMLRFAAVLELRAIRRRAVLLKLTEKGGAPRG